MKQYSRVGVVILKDDQLLVMRRKRDGQEYYAFLGGGPEGSETLEETAIRELKEETNLDIKLGPVLCEAEGWYDPKKWGSYYLCTEFTGTPELGGPEKEKSCPENYFELAWLSLDEAQQVKLYPEEVLKTLLDSLKK